MRVSELRDFFRAIHPEKIKVQKKLVIFGFFLAISTVLWLLQALGKDYVSVIRYPVRFSNFPSGKVLVDEPPGFLNLKVSATGFSLLRFKAASAVIPLNFDLGLVGMEEVPGDSSVLPTQLAQPVIARQLGDEIRLLAIEPETIFFRFSALEGKKLPVLPVISLKFKPQYHLKGFVYSIPDSVVVVGPKLILDTMKAVPTQYAEFLSIDNQVERSIDLKEIPNLRYSQPQVKVLVPSEKFTENRFAIPVEPVHVPDSLILRTFPSRVQVSFMVGLSNFQRTKPYMFRAEVDFSKIDYRTASLSGFRLPVHLSRMPSHVIEASVYPTEVEFIIERK